MDTNTDDNNDYNIKVKVSFSVKDFTKKLISNDLNQSKAFAIGTNEWSIVLCKANAEDSENCLYVCIKLKKSLQRSVKTYVDVCLKDFFGEKRHHLCLGFCELFKDNNGIGFVLSNKVFNSNLLLLPNDCLTILFDIKVLQEFIDFNNKSVNNFESVFNIQELNDLKLIYKGKEYFVSKAILSSSSPVFQSIFSNQITNVFVIEDIDVDVFEEFLHFIYSGKLSKIEEMADKLLCISERFEVKGLKRICEVLLIFDLNLNNVVNTLIIADNYNCRQLKDKAMQYILNNVFQFESKDFEILCTNHKELSFELMAFRGNVCKTESEVTFKGFYYRLS